MTKTIHWCGECQTPVILEGKRGVCTLCEGVTKHMCVDIRPVFPEERLLVEILMQKPFSFIEQNVWASTRGRYYVDGKSVVVPQELYSYKNAESVRSSLEKHSTKNSNKCFDASVERFIRANASHLSEIELEAMEFTRKIVERYSTENIVISFSGGKDSTVCADIVLRALAPVKPVILFGDTTLEYPQTYEYVERFKAHNPDAAHVTARNNKQNFFEMCEDIGVPSRRNRWCCTIFKTGPISKEFTRNYKHKAVLSFIGARAAESSARSKYERVHTNIQDKKIQQQIPIYPIFNFAEIDVWLYILSKRLDFNYAYQLGYKRVGCWLCPNSIAKSFFLNNVHFPKQANDWREQLIRFAKETGKTDIEDYVDNLRWTYRYGGANMKSSDDIIVKSIGCTTEEYAKIYELKKPLHDSFYTMFTPFGMVSQGRKLIDEVLILDSISGEPILSIQPMHSSEYSNSVKIKALVEKGQAVLQRKAVYQVRKYNACRDCGKCDDICSNGAIQIEDGIYRISDSACTRCQKCINPKYMSGGCQMYKVLKTKGAAS